MNSIAKNELKEFDTGVQTLEKQAANLATITNDEQLTEATNLLGQVKAFQKEVKAKKAAILDPLKESMAEVKELFKPLEERHAALETVLKPAMLAYHDAKDAAAVKEAERIERRLDKGTMKIETGMARLAEIDQARSSIQGDSGAAQFRQGAQKVRVLDPFSLPAEYFKRERVLEALRLEVAADVRRGLPCPRGAETYREKIVAGKGL